MKNNNGWPKQASTQEFAKWFNEYEAKEKKRSVAFSKYNPELHIVVTIEESDRLNQLKTLSEAVAILAKVQEKEQTEIKETVNFIKGLYTTPAKKETKISQSVEEKKAALKALYLKPRRK